METELVTMDGQARGVPETVSRPASAAAFAAAQVDRGKDDAPL